MSACLTVAAGASAIILILLGFGACKPAPSTKQQPLGPYSFLFRGGVTNQNKFDPYRIDPCPPRGSWDAPPIKPEPETGGGDPPVNVLALLVDTSTNRFTGSSADATSYRNAKRALLQNNVNSYWNEASYGNISVNCTMPDKVLHMPGAFDDYFNRTFAPATLTTQNLGPFPKTFGANDLVLHIRDAHSRNRDVTLPAAGAYADINALQTACQAALDAAPSVPNPWVKCTANGNKLVFTLADLETKEGSFIRVKEGANRALLGCNGPIETPGAGGNQASMTGKPISFPVTVTGGVEFEVRNKNLLTRRYKVSLSAQTYNDATALSGTFAALLNADFGWVEAFNAGNAVGLRLISSQSGDNAAIRVVSGSARATLGLDGPDRVDGVINAADTNTVRGGDPAIVGQALALYAQDLAAGAGIPVDAAHDSTLRTLTSSAVLGYDTILVMFVDQMAGVIPDKRAAATLGSRQVKIQMPYQTPETAWDVQAGLMVGIGNERWETWAHELGHNLGFVDLYKQPEYDKHFNDFYDYLNCWSLMVNHLCGNHVDAWHKRKISWIPGVAIAEVLPPPSGATETHTYTLAPLEYKFADYAGTGTPGADAKQLVRIQLSSDHWIQLENRQPGVAHSQFLPDDVNGYAGAAAGPNHGGLLVTDTVNPQAPFLYRSAVTVLNPDGAAPPAPAGTVLQARAIHNGETLDFTTTYPAYGGIKARVTGIVPGPAGKPSALRVDVERGPGDFLELGIRRWHAPEVYATEDIWIDWPGNGIEDYLTSDPPLGSGDQPHWDPEGGVLNWVKVRIHNTGTIEAKGVVVRAFYNDPIGVGDKGTFIPFPDSPPQDIPAGGFKNFAFDWRPTKKGHTCLRAEIFTHDTAFGDLDPTNNDAQENIDEFSPESGSPYMPYDFTFKANNDYQRPIRVAFYPTGLPDGMDVELEQPEIELGPDEEATVRGRLFVDIAKIPAGPASRRKCAWRFNINALRHDEDSYLPFGGVTIAVEPGVPSSLRFGEIQPAESNGRKVVIVRGVLSGDFHGNQPVDVAVIGSDNQSHGGRGTTENSGSFAVEVPDVPAGPARVMLYYFGPDMAKSSAGPKEVDVPKL